MVTHRIPIKRKGRTQEFTPELIEAFENLRNVFEEGDCACPPKPPPKSWQPGDPPFSERPPRCEACRAYDQATSKVVGLLHLKPWQLLENPYCANPYPPGTPAWQGLEDRKRLKNDIRGGFALWRRLEAACGLQPLNLDEDEE